MVLDSPTAQFAWPTVPIDRGEFLRLFQATNHVQYLLGAKPSMATAPRTIHTSDCSGWYRWMVHHSTNGKTTPTDGSYKQWQQCERAGLKLSSKASCKLKDDVVRAVFLPPNSKGVGHVAFVLNGMVYECCSGHGVRVTAWTGRGWQARVVVYVLKA